jgi:NAD(P)-dependent dehydrogenase (short-subunit alcohol dehydrogenase family)
MTGLEGMRCVITGGSSGIGLAVAEALVASGAHVCIVAHRRQPLEEAVERLGEGASWECCDVADAEAVGALAATLEARWPALDGLVNNAGLATMADLESTEPELWDRTFAVNVRGPFLMMRLLLPLLRRAGGASVVNVSSTLAEKAIPGMAAYNAAKAALNQLTRSAAVELAPAVRVNAVMPAVVDTPIHRQRGLTAADVERMGAIHPLGRVGTPADVANLVLFLLSNRSAWMTGAVIPVDGGMMAT